MQHAQEQATHAGPWSPNRSAVESVAAVDLQNISIIIPAYNSGRFLSKTISSVLAQTFANWELVIVDDGSADDTSEIAARFAERDDRIRVIRQANGGIAAARNRGFLESGGASEFVIFLDHDDLWEADTLETLLAALNEDPGAPAAYGTSGFIDEHDRAFQPGWLESWHLERNEARDRRVVPLAASARTTFAAEIYENRISTMGQVLIRRSAIERLAHTFDPRMAPCDDWDLYLRLALTGDLVFLPRVVLSRRIHANNVSSNHQAMTQKEDFIRGYYMSSPELSSENRRIARDAYQTWYVQGYKQRMSWLRGCVREGKFWDTAKQARHAACLLLRVLLPGATARFAA